MEYLVFVTKERQLFYCIPETNSFGIKTMMFSPIENEKRQVALKNSGENIYK